MEFIPASGMVLVDMEFDNSEKSIIPTADLNYERMGKVIKGFDIPLSFNIAPGDILCFDEYGYRRFTYKDKNYTVVDVSNGALWAVIKEEHVGTETEPVQT